MKKTAKSIGCRTLAAYLRTTAAIGGVLFAVASSVACGPPGSGMADDGGSLINPDSAVAASDAGTGVDVSRQPAAPDGGQQPVPPNATCTVDAQCASGFCVDGVCCDAACNGSC